MITAFLSSSFSVLRSFISALSSVVGGGAVVAESGGGAVYLNSNIFFTYICGE